MIYSKYQRAVREVVPPKLRKLWKDWDIRVAVLLSLTLQILLIILGPRRKHSPRLLIRIVVWSAYLAADAVATFALGTLSNNLTDLYDEKAESQDPNTELMAFWAPFLLLHMGGPDTITAYALEDNELWLRHFLGLIMQTVIALYVFLMAWTGSQLSILSILMIVAGFIKYGERTWALRSASSDKLRESTFVDRVSESQFSDDFKGELVRKSAEGYIVGEDRFIEVPLPIDLSIINEHSDISEEGKLLTSYGLIELTKRLFVDSVLTSKDRDTTRTVFRNMSSENAFQVIEICLGFMYDFFYTKASLLHTQWGVGLRLVTSFITCLSLALFTLLVDRNKYSTVDISTTWILLVVAVILEIYSALLLLSSDRFIIWWSMHKREIQITSSSNTLLQLGPTNSFINSLFRRPRWSHRMYQLSLLTLFFNEKPLPFLDILKLLNTDHKMLEKRWYLSYEDQASKDLKKLIFRYFKEKVAEEKSAKPKESSESCSSRYFIIFPTAKGEAFSDKYFHVAPNFQEYFGNSIFFWHCFTEASYCIDRRDIEKLGGTDVLQYCGLIMQISRYMLYLLLLHPSTLPVDGIDPMSFQKTVDMYRYQLGRYDARMEIEQETRMEVQEETRSEVLEEMRSEVVEEMKSEVLKSIRLEVRGEIFREAKAKFKGMNFEAEFEAKFDAEFGEKFKAKRKAEFGAKLQAKIEAELDEKLQAKVAAGFQAKFEAAIQAKIKAEIEASKGASIIVSEMILSERPFDYSLKLFAEGFVTAKHLKSEGEMVRHLFILKFFSLISKRVHRN